MNKIKTTLSILSIVLAFTVTKAKAQAVTLTEPDTSKVKADKIFISVEVNPTFPGGIAKFYQYLAANILYPVNAAKNRTQGKVFISFVVEKDGSLTDLKVIRGLSDDIDAEAIRVVKASPPWTPGIQNGKPVRALFTTLIVFKLPAQAPVPDTSKQTAADTAIYTDVDQQAVPQGGIQTFYQYLQRNTHYPAAAREDNKQGKEVFTLIIEKDGSLLYLRIDKSISTEIDKEVVRVVSGYPKWVPAMKNGQPVRSQYTMNLSFVIDGDIAYITPSSITP